MPEEIEPNAAPANPAKIETPNEGNQPSNLTKDQVNAMIEAALSQRVNPLHRDLRKLSTERQEKVDPIIEENRSTKEQLKQLLAERAQEKAAARDISITTHLERSLKGIPEDSIDMAVSYLKQTYGAQLDVDGKGKLVFKDEYGDVQNGQAFVDMIMKNPAIGRLLPPVTTPNVRGLKGNNQAGGSKPRFSELSHKEQQAMSTQEVSAYVRQWGG